MIPAPVMHVLTTLALLCSLSLEPVKPIPPEPMPAAMTAGAVLTAPEPDLVEMLACGIYQEAKAAEARDDTGDAAE